MNPNPYDHYLTGEDCRRSTVNIHAPATCSDEREGDGFGDGSDMNEDGRTAAAVGNGIDGNGKSQWRGRYHIAAGLNIMAALALRF